MKARTLAVEPVPVEVARQAVGGRHHRYAFFEHRRKQARQDHGVGRVGHLHLVEAEQPRLLADGLRHRRDGITLLALARGAQAPVDVEHEGMEMDPALRLHRNMVEGEVHQHRLAAPHPAPEIDPARGLGPAPEQSPKQPGPAIGQFTGQPVERSNRALLVGIGLQLSGRDHAA